MQGITGKAAQTAQVFQEIPGESVSDRRLRYWEWSRVQAKIHGKKARYGKNLKDAKRVTIQLLTKELKSLTRQVEAMRSELAKHGYTIPVGE